MTMKLPATLDHEQIHRRAVDMLMAAPDMEDALLDVLAYWYDQIMDVDCVDGAYKMDRPEAVMAAEDAYTKACGMDLKDVYVSRAWLQHQIYTRIASNKREALVCAADHEREARQGR